MPEGHLRLVDAKGHHVASLSHLDHFPLCEAKQLFIFYYMQPNTNLTHPILFFLTDTKITFFQRLKFSSNSIKLFLIYKAGMKKFLLQCTMALLKFKIGIFFPITKLDIIYTYENI